MSKKKPTGKEIVDKLVDIYYNTWYGIFPTKKRDAAIGEYIESLEETFYPEETELIKDNKKGK